MNNPKSLLYFFYKVLIIIRHLQTQPDPHALILFLLQPER